MDIVLRCKELLRSHLGGKICKYEKNHPWRKDSKHILLHTFRVYSYSLRIIEGERENLSIDEIKLIQVAVLLHDIGKCDVKVNHGEKSAEIVHAWLAENHDIAEEIYDKERLLKIIKEHSNKDDEEKDLCAAILKDADMLDEIGVLSIFMASNKVDRNSPYFFNELLHKIETFEMDFCNVQLEKLKTKEGKRILEEKINFIDYFANQLSSEIKGTDEEYEKNINNK